MKDTKKKHSFKWWSMGFIFIVSVVILAGGYWLYQRSLGRAVYATTVSFMEQIADHDHLNIVNQLNSKWEYLNSILERIRASRDRKLKEVVYNLGVESRATDFKKLYLITDNGQVYSSSYLETSLENMPWKEAFRDAKGNFVTGYSEESREQWGEYLLYGNHLAVPVPCGEINISGVVGLVPIAEITSQMRLESFDGQGIAVVMRPTGEIITASQQYSSTVTQNFLTPLEKAHFFEGGSYKACKEAIEKNEGLFVNYSLNGENFYALFQPMDHHGGSDWYLVVQVSAQVTAKQVKILIMRSLPFFFVLETLILLVTFFVYHSINTARIARASEEAKSVFLTNMSHEIRTPLNGIVGLQYLMRQNLDNREKLEEYLKKAEVSADFLKNVITDVLDMSKIESGQLEVYQNEIDLHSIVKEIEALLVTQAEERELRLRVDCQKMCQPFVRGDALRIKQVLTNLLGNALKFTPKGGEISLTVLQQMTGSIADTTFIVADTGCGMSPEFLEHIWQPFEQEKRLASQNGTGLGTTLSKTLVEKMGGTISVESYPERGTVFTVSVPLPVTQTSVPAVEEPKNEEEWELKGKRVLVAEDNEINRTIVVSILEELGCELTEAVNGKEAVEAFKSSPICFYDLVLMDVQMPVMDGHEATRQIRGLKRPDSAGVIILAMTANAFQEDIDKAIESGMNDVATKPLDIALLLQKIKNLKGRVEKR